MKKKKKKTLSSKKVELIMVNGKDRIFVYDYNENFIFRPKLKNPLLFVIKISKKNELYLVAFLIETIIKQFDSKYEFIVFCSQIKKKTLKIFNKKIFKKSFINFVFFDKFFRQSKVFSEINKKIYNINFFFLLINKILSSSENYKKIIFLNDVLMIRNLKILENINDDNNFFYFSKNSFINNFTKSYEKIQNEKEISLLNFNVLIINKKLIEKICHDSVYDFKFDDLFDYFKRLQTLNHFVENTDKLKDGIQNYFIDEEIYLIKNTGSSNFMELYQNIINETNGIFFTLFLRKNFKKLSILLLVKKNKIKNNHFFKHLLKKIINLFKTINYLFFSKIKNLIKNLYSNGVINSLFRLKNKEKGKMNIAKNIVNDRVLVFLDTQNAIGDSLMLLQFALCLNKFSILNYEIDILVNKQIEFLLKKICWNSNINFIYKNQTIGNHYSYSNFFKSLDVYKKIFKNWLNKEYKFVFFFLPWMLIDSMAIIQAIEFDNLYKIKSRNSSQKDFNLGISPTPNHKITEKIILYLEEKKSKFINIDNGFFNKKHGSEIAVEIWNKVMNDQVIFSFNDISYFFDAPLLSNVKKILFMVNRPEERTINPLFVIKILNNIYKKEQFEVLFVGLKDVEKEFKKLEDKIDFNFENLIGKTNSLEELMNIVASVDFVIGIDSSIFHISCLLNKKILTFINIIGETSKYLFNYWLKYPKGKLVKFFLEPNYFLYDWQTVNNFLLLNNEKIINEISKVFIDFMKNERETNCSYLLNRNHESLYSRSEEEHEN